MLWVVFSDGSTHHPCPLIILNPAPQAWMHLLNLSGREAKGCYLWMWASASKKMGRSRQNAWRILWFEKVIEANLKTSSARIWTSPHKLCRFINGFHLYRFPKEQVMCQPHPCSCTRSCLHGYWLCLCIWSLAFHGLFVFVILVLSFLCKCPRLNLSWPEPILHV